MQKPIEDVFNSLEEMIGGQKNEDSIDNDCETDKFSFKPKRRGFMNLDTLSITELYNDNLKYEFRDNELH